MRVTLKYPMRGMVRVKGLQAMFTEGRENCSERREHLRGLREDARKRKKENIYWHHILKFFPLDLTTACLCVFVYVVGCVLSCVYGREGLKIWTLNFYLFFGFFSSFFFIF